MGFYDGAHDLLRVARLAKAWPPPRRTRLTVFLSVFVSDENLR